LLIDPIFLAKIIKIFQQWYLQVLVEGVWIEVCRDGWCGFVQAKPKRPSLPINHSIGLAPASSAFKVGTQRAFLA
jgi:hypothetical protein